MTNMEYAPSCDKEVLALARRVRFMKGGAIWAHQRTDTEELVDVCACI